MEAAARHQRHPQLTPTPTTPRRFKTILTWDRDNEASIASSIAFARENARIIREVISADMWERMNYYYLWLQSAGARDLYDNNRADFYNQIKRINQLVDGIGEGTMLHGEAVGFLQARQVPRTRLPDRPHTRRQVSPGAIEPAACRHRSRKRSLDRDSEKLLGLRAVSQTSAIQPGTQTQASRSPAS